MKTKRLVGFSAVVLAAAIALYGCGGGGGGGSSSPPPSTSTPITSSSQAQKAGAVSASTATVSANMGQTLSSVASPKPGAPRFRSALAGKDPRVARFNQALETAMKAPRARVAAIRKAQGFKAPVLIATYDCSAWNTTTATTNIAGIHGFCRFFIFNDLYRLPDG